ncbi:MAG: hypothetical protein ACUVR3_08505 [Candidatus Roseilinea sp.]|uniref:hypothetical protein n=1 Tax=Candidatus Roseilinea sp. TaxID=2838777 RepID=UPI00404ACF73
MITLDAIRLPDGLRWEDELTWTPISQATEYSLTGALLIQEGVRQTGRPVTLVGGRSGHRSYAWMTRAEVIALRAALDVTGTRFTLTLHDGRRLPVTARHDGDGPLNVSPVPIVDDIGPADPKPGTLYVLNTLRLMLVGPIVPP